MLLRLLLSPPLAIARLGSSETQLECFHWGANDDRPRGTGKTTVVPGETLRVAEDGTVTAYVPSAVQFKDGDSYRPVCPFFELHGEWEDGPRTRTGPVTRKVLKAHGLTAAKLLWTVRAGNLKAFHMTRDPGTRIDAHEEIHGDQVRPVELRGVSSARAKKSLVPVGHYIPLGSVRLTQPTDEFPEFRLRFTPAKGRFYGPPDLRKVWNVDIPESQLFLNPESSWVGFIPALSDLRTSPEYLYAGEGSETRASYGVVDDVCNAIITCSVPGSKIAPAVARVTVSPPDYAPDRRHLITIADALKDYTDRAEVWDPTFYSSTETAAEIQDLFERILETMWLTNVDVFNNRVDVQENPARAFALGIPYKSTDHYSFPPQPAIAGQNFPISDRGRQFHRRMVAIEVLRDLLRERPELLEKWIRPPGGNNGFFTSQMPPVMRDSSGGPLHLSRRQYDLLLNWAASVRIGIEEES